MIYKIISSQFILTIKFLKFLNTMQLDPEWQALDFERDVRATQLRKLATQQE